MTIDGGRLLAGTRTLLALVLQKTCDASPIRDHNVEFTHVGFRLCSGKTAFGKGDRNMSTMIPCEFEQFVAEAIASGRFRSEEEAAAQTFGLL
jgi:hypothetical protein